MEQILNAKMIRGEGLWLKEKTYPIIKTDCGQLNSILNGGLMRQELYVIQAATGVGKSTMLRRLALNVLESGQKVLFISCGEETIEENLVKIACMYNGIGFNRMNKYDDKSRDLIDRFINEYGDNLYLLYDSNMTRKSFVEYAKVITLEEIHYIIIDYLGCLESDDERKVTTSQFLTTMADFLKEYAYHNEKCIITAMQMNREYLNAKKGKEFNPSSVDGQYMAKSLGVATKATTCIALFKYQEEMYLNVFKNRSNGQTGVAKISMIQNTFKMVDEKK